MGFTGFYWVGLSLIVFSSVLRVFFTGFSWIDMGFTGYCQVSPGLLGLTGFSRVF